MRRLDDEDGGITVIIALCLVVFFGFAALAVDVGALYAERRQLQSGADAGALAIAEDCARGTIDCVAAVVEDIAEDYADLNANDAATLAEDVELDLNPRGESKVTVTTLTEDPTTGNDSFSLMFARVLGFTDTQVRAQATARWGPAVAVEGFPLGVCQDLWQANRPDPATADPGPTIDIRYKGPGNDPPENDCLDGEGENFNPGTNPGNFSWLDTADGSCSTYYDFSDGSITASGDTGANVPNECSDEINDMIADIRAHKAQVGNLIHADPADNLLPIRVLPIYSEVNGTGTNAEYQLVTFGAFEFSGLKTTGGQNDVVDAWSKPQCRGNGANNLCFQGRFIKEVEIGEIGEGADSDVIIVELTR